MRMRASVVWGAAALAFLAATSALRPTQVENGTRISRRLTVPSDPDSNTLTTVEQDKLQPTIRSRGARRHEETSTQKEIFRKRTRTTVDVVPIAQAEPQSTPKNEQFESRRSRIRSQPSDIESSKEVSLSKEIRSRSRGNSRRPTSTTPAAVSVTTPKPDEVNIKIVKSNEDNITKKASSAEISDGTSQLKRKSTVLINSPETITPKRSRSRFNVRPNVKPVDLEIAGTTNTFSVSEKAPTTVRIASDLRNSRKLRYKTRTSETDTNIPGEGLVSNEVIKSSQNKQSVTSQKETGFNAPIINETIAQSTETNKPTTNKKMLKVVRRPLSGSKRNLNFRPSLTLPQVSKVPDEISEDDNYPASFKALIQSKNASTQVSSPNSESLSLKGSQKVYTTYSTSSQSTLSGSVTNKYSRLRNNQVTEEIKTDSKEEINIVETTLAPDASTPKPSEYKPRGTYTPRNRKHRFTVSSTLSTPLRETNSEKPVYKYNRKLKTSSTESPSSIKNKQTESSNTLKKPIVRPPFHLRKSKVLSNKNLNLTEIPVSGSEKTDNSVKKPQIVTLPRTSHYSRSRNITAVKVASSTAKPAEKEISQVVIKESVSTLETPVVFDLLTNLENKEATETETHLETKEKDKILILVTNKESMETTTHEVTNLAEESGNQPILNIFSTVPTKQDTEKFKYHSNYKDQKLTNNNDPEVFSSTAYPPVRNLQTRNYGQNHGKFDEAATTPKSQRNVRKFSESFFKTTEASNNGITPEPEKSKSRFSSKYRASYDKQFYKPTVPTITPSTVEGEEIQLGPDLNAISFTQTRSTLTSADLRLSESLIKPAHVMNVEMSHHSPSVTISIFDALAEILTSTPRPQLSSTTEVTTTLTVNTDVKHVPNGVSDKVNVNNISDLASQNTFMSNNANISTTTKSVQLTLQTPSVINSMVGAIVTRSLSTEGGNAIPVNTPQHPEPLPTPTTPVSARKPFAIKILYSDTESPTDKPTTVPPPTQGLTDSSKMVPSSLSDLMLSSNNLLSSELTSMLSNNIQSIIENMDESSRSMLNYVDMQRILKNLIPRAINDLTIALENTDSTPNTTPYSLDDIKDTENIVINGIQLNDDVQNVARDKNVNITVEDRNVFTKSTQIPTNVNIPTTTTPGPLSTKSVFNSQVTPAATANPIFGSLDSPSTTLIGIINSEAASSPVSLETDSSNVDSINDELSSVSTNYLVPSPFLTNFQSEDFTNSNIDEDITTKISGPIPLSKASALGNDELTALQDPSKISPLQLWVLSKKAKVLKMIEDLIREHNTELATAPPLTEFVSSSNNFNLSQRLSNIMDTMSVSTETVMTDMIESTSPLTSTSLIENPLSTMTVDSATVDKSDNLPTTTTTATTGLQANNEVSSTSTENNIDVTTVAATTTTIMDKTTPNVLPTSTTYVSTTEDPPIQIVSRNEDSSAIINPVSNADSTNSITTSATDMTTQVTTEMTTSSLDLSNTEASGENTTSTTQNSLPVGTPIPKKDYVIFGILPNNTVVRKDPNEDVLETLTEASPYIIYGVLPNNTIIRKFPNGTRVPRVMQRIDILPISPSSLRNPYSPVHNNPAIVRPQSNPIRVSTNNVTVTDISNNGTKRLTNDTVNNQQTMISSSALNNTGSYGITTTNMPEKSTASHVLSLRTTTMLPSIDEILLNSLSSAAKQDMVISEMTSSTREPRILTLDIDPETKQIRTEKPGNGDGSAVFKFIPIDEVMVQKQGSNVQKLSTKTTTTEVNTQTPQIQTQETYADATTSQITTSIMPEATVVSSAFTNAPMTTVDLPNAETTTLFSVTTGITATMMPTTIVTVQTTPASTTQVPTTTVVPSTDTIQMSTTTQVPTIQPELTTLSIEEELRRYKQDVQLLKSLLQATGRDPKSLNLNQNLLLSGEPLTTVIPSTTSKPITTTTTSTTTQNNDPAKLLQALFTNLNNPTKSSSPNLGVSTQKATTQQVSGTSRSIEDDIKQFEEDTKFLQALLQVTGQNPATLKPLLENLTTARTPMTKITTTPMTTTTNTPKPTTTTITTTPRPTTTSTTTIKPTTTTTNLPTITTNQPTTTFRSTTTQSIQDDIKQFQEDTKFLQALLQATGQNPANFNNPTISGVTSNVRIASNPRTTSSSSPSNPTTTQLNVQPVFTTTNIPVVTLVPRTIAPTLQPTTANGKISTTYQPFNLRRQPTTTIRGVTNTLTGQRVSGVTSTTTMPSTSTFSVEEDLAFLNNLKSVLGTNPKDEDPESALANRIIALAVEKSLNEIKTGKPDANRSGKNINVGANNLILDNTARQTTTVKQTTTTTTTTPRQITTPKPTTTITQRISTTVNYQSIDDDIRQFQEDTKLLQALLKATGQDPSKLNLPTLPPNINVSPNLPKGVNEDLNLLSNLLASPSPLNEPFDPLTPKPFVNTKNDKFNSALPYGAKIAVKDNLNSVQDDKKLLQTLIKLQDVQETTTLRNKLTITGQSADEALKKLVQQQKQSGTFSEATRAPISLSTEYGKSNDALLAALLKEQGFGPTTANSLDEQLRLSALLNQVVVTPKVRRTTTPPPPPPAPRRPVLDGLAWLWQQWRETGSGNGSPKSNSGPSSVPSPSSRPASSGTSTRVSWLGSGPFVGNADDTPGNRIPLDPPRAAEQIPGRGQLVSAAINVTRAFSQFLGAAIQGAAQTVQNVFRAGQQVATDVYSNGSGGSG